MRVQKKKNMVKEKRNRTKEGLHWAYSTAWHDCLSCFSCLVYVITALNLVLLQNFLSLYSLFGKGSSHCWHWVQEGSLRVPLPSRTCKTRSTSRATTKSTTRTWAIIILNCKEIEKNDKDIHHYYMQLKQATVKDCQLTSVGISTRANCSLNSGDEPVRSPTIAKPDTAILHSRGRFSLRDSMKGWPYWTQ